MGYTIYGYGLSYFTRKIEAAFQWYGLEATLEPKTLLRKRRIEKNGGTHQVPVVRAPDGRWHTDTTPMIEMLDGLHPERRLFPAGETGVLVRLVEEWLDEWFPRVVIHYRWNDPENAAFAGAALGAQMLPFAPGFVQRKLGAKVASWGKRAVRALALSEPHQRQAVEAELARTLAAAAAQLEETPYLLGHRPTAADAAFMGALRAHVGADPTTARILADFPVLTAWMKADPRWDAAGTLAPLDAPTPFARFVLSEASGAYQTFLVANGRALEAGQKAFEVTLNGAETSMLARRYPETSRRALRAAIARDLDPAQQAQVAAFLDDQELTEAFA